MDPIQIPGYPQEVFYMAALIGVVLILLRPRWAFLFIVFSLACRNFDMAVFTRTPYLSEFVNLNDLLLWIGVLAWLRTAGEGGRIWVPSILLAIIGILILGDFQVLFQYGLVREVMQACWGAWVFPIMFFIAANMVKDLQDARPFYLALFLGAVVAALQHLVFIQTRESMMSLFTVGSLRTISFIMSGGIFLVISAFFIDMRRLSQNTYLFIFWFLSLPVITISYILSFTRTIWVGAFMSVVALFLLFYRERGRVIPRLGYSLVILALLLLAFKLTDAYLLPDVNVTESINERADFVRYEDTFDEAYQTRETGMETELGLWKNGTIIWGVGTAYDPSLWVASIESINSTGALNHVAFSAYLAHFGLIGFLTYGLLLPFLTIKIGKRYFLQHKQDFGGVIAMTAMAMAFFDVFTLLSSNHYLGPTTQVQGLIYGALWGLTRPLEVNSIKHRLGKVLTRQSWQQRLPGPVNQIRVDI